jgi:hypothetical protein
LPRGDRTDLVQPFYLKMMRSNALKNGAQLLPEIAEKGATLGAADVIALLQDPWRATVMGAWFALLQDDEAVTTAVLRALEASEGSLTSPPLAVVAVVLAENDALPALVAYAARDEEYARGACGFVAAAAAHLGGSVACTASEADSNDFNALLSLARRLRSLR